MTKAAQGGSLWAVMGMFIILSGLTEGGPSELAVGEE